MEKKILLALFVLFVNEMNAHTLQQDSIQTDNNLYPVFQDSVEFDTTGFDARPFLMQKRYVPQNTSFIKKKRWSDHLFIDMSAGFLWMDQSQNERKLTDGSQGSLYFGKDFTSIHSARLGIGFNQFKDTYSRHEQMSYTFHADYLCNFSSMLLGYNPQRWLDVSGVLGGSYYKTDFHGLKDNAYGLNLGLQFLLKAGSNTGVTIEPGLTFLSDGYDMVYDNTRHHGHLSYGVKFGLKYIFTDENRSWPKDSLKYWQKNTFAEFSLGANGCSNDTYSLFGSAGYKYSAAIGKWFTPGIGVRLGMTAASNRWKESITYVQESKEHRRGYVREEMQAHGGGRIEALINPMGFGNPQKFNRHALFSVNLAVGGEYGWMIKSDFTEENKIQSVKSSYLGFTGALQMLFKICRDIDLFVEPRVTFLGYEIPYENRPDLSKDYMDNVFSLNAGVRVSAPTKKEREEIEKQNHLFLPHFYASAEGGINNFMQSRKFKEAPTKMGWANGIAGGYRFNPYLGVKASCGIGQFSAYNLYNYTEYLNLNDGLYRINYRGLWERKLTQLTASLDLEVNLTNLYMGYNPNRLINVNMLIGPSFAAIIDKSDKLISNIRVGDKTVINGKSVFNSAWGLEGGFAVTASISDQIQIYLLPKITVLPREYMEGNSVTALGSTVMLSTSMGVSYLF